MNRAQLTRYSRQLLLPEISLDDQARLLRARVLLIGLGGLGSPAAMYLASSGVGRLLLCDDDQVELSNLHRQLLHCSSDIGRSKCVSARDTLKALNPDLEVELLETRLTAPELDGAVASADVVLDASDNFATRFAVNEACARQHTPLISGAAIRLEGQVALFRHDLAGGPCYRCLYAPGDVTEGGNCQDSGILPPVTGIIGSIMATEALKRLLDIGNGLDKRLLILDARDMTLRTSRLAADPHCPVCARQRQRRAEHLLPDL